ncbi:hypothetical protein GF336_03265 [Candidatus Woesearchaeota archaeon]|nr:hypothetical protein [Candidatus Woesearchaeota archaeon]
MAKKLEELLDALFQGISNADSNGSSGHIYVVDTNIVHGFPEAVEFLAQEHKEKNTDEPNIIIMPDVVRRELNGLKKNYNVDKARDARAALKGLQKYIAENEKITEDRYGLGVKFSKGSLMFFMPYSSDNKKFPELRSSFGGDDQILSCALALRSNLKDELAEKVSIVSDDSDMHTSCFQFGMPSARFEEFYKDYDYDGIIEIDLEAAEQQSSKAYKLHNELSKAGNIKLGVEDIIDLTKEDIYPNQFVKFKGERVNPNMFFRIDNRKENLSNVFRHLNNFFNSQRNNNIKHGYTPTPEQECVLELLYDPSIDYVTLSGPPGGGKTMLPLDVGMTMLQEESIYSLVVANPPIESQHGYLPGSKNEKLKIENQNIFDSLYFVLGANNIAGRKKADAEMEIFERI